MFLKVFGVILSGQCCYHLKSQFDDGFVKIVFLILQCKLTRLGRNRGRCLVLVRLINHMENQ